MFVLLRVGMFVLLRVWIQKLGVQNPKPLMDLTFQLKIGPYFVANSKTRSILLSVGCYDLVGK